MTDKDKYVLLFLEIDRNSGWIELWTDGTFRLQPKLNNWSKTKESTYEIRPPPVYPSTYQRPTSKGKKWWTKNKETS